MFSKPKCKLTTSELYSEDWEQFKCEMTPPFTCNCCNGLLRTKKRLMIELINVIIIVILSIKCNYLILLVVVIDLMHVHVL